MALSVNHLTMLLLASIIAAGFAGIDGQNVASSACRASEDGPGCPQRGAAMIQSSPRLKTKPKRVNATVCACDVAIQRKTVDDEPKSCDEICQDDVDDECKCQISREERCLLNSCAACNYCNTANDAAAPDTCDGSSPGPASEVPDGCDGRCAFNHTCCPDTGRCVPGLTLDGCDNPPSTCYQTCGPGYVCCNALASACLLEEDKDDCPCPACASGVDDASECSAETFEQARGDGSSLTCCPNNALKDVSKH